MCGRYAVTLPPEAMAQLFGTLNAIDFPPRYNIAPTQPIVAIWEEGGSRTARLVRWGLVPGWVKDPREFPLLVNARAEGMLDKPAFRTALRHHRCVVPASGYYEWHTGPDKKKQPFYITRADGRPFAFAGLYSTWLGPNGEEIDTAATITVAANPELSAIHDRMPAILAAEEVAPWLDVRHVDAKEASAQARPLAPGLVRFHPVDPRVGSAHVEGPELIEPFAPPAEPAEPPPKPEKPRKAASGQLDLF